jgi:hypothetical protein
MEVVRPLGLRMVGWTKYGQKKLGPKPILQALQCV